MSPEVAEAVGVLREKAILSEGQAAHLLSVARRELVSVRFELKALLYGGVLLLVSGVGLFLKQNQDRIGPAAIASLLAAAAALCFVFVQRRSPPFSWGASASPHVAADYVLLLGVLLVGSDLAYIETQFRLLGPDWAYHLLVLALIALAAAYRYDSRVVLSLAVTSFAAWRGLSARLPLESVFGNRPGAVRANALGCAALFLAAGLVSAQAKKKSHFESVFTAFGLLLLFGGLLSGVFQDDSNWLLWELAALAAAAAVITFAYRSRRVFDFAIGTVAGYLALLRPLWEALKPAGEAFFFVVAASSLGVLVLLAFVSRSLRRGR